MVPKYRVQTLWLKQERRTGRTCKPRRVEYEIRQGEGKRRRWRKGPEAGECSMDDTSADAHTFGDSDHADDGPLNLDRPSKCGDRAKPEPGISAPRGLGKNTGSSSPKSTGSASAACSTGAFRFGLGEGAAGPAVLIPSPVKEPSPKAVTTILGTVSSPVVAPSRRIGALSGMALLRSFAWCFVLRPMGGAKSPRRRGDS